jgi:UDP-glucose 4-epimerase
MKNILLIGANSYVGRNFLKYISSDSNLSIIPWTSANCNLLNPESIKHAFSSLPKGEWSIVFLSVINKFAQNDYDSMLKNISIVKNFIDYSQNINIASLIYFSAVDVYGNNPPRLINEDSQVAPESWYSLAKLNCEWMFSHDTRINYPVCIARIPGVYGSGGEERSIPYRMIQSVLKTGKITVEGTGETLRDMLLLSDLFEILTKLINTPYSGILNLVTGKSLSINEIASHVQKLFNKTPAIEHQKSDSKRNFNLVFDNSRLQKICPSLVFADFSKGIASYNRIINNR